MKRLTKTEQIHLKDLEIIKLEGEQKKCNLILTELLKHLSSKKFFCGDRLDGYISTQDVHNRIMEARKELSNEVLRGRYHV